MSRWMSIMLPDDLAQMVEEKVASGEYASEGDVLEDGLRALNDEQSGVEDGLGEAVKHAYDQWLADPSGSVSLDEAFEECYRHIDRVAARSKP